MKFQFAMFLFWNLIYVFEEFPAQRNTIDGNCLLAASAALIIWFHSQISWLYVRSRAVSVWDAPILTLLWGCCRGNVSDSCWSCPQNDRTVRRLRVKVTRWELPLYQGLNNNVEICINKFLVGRCIGCRIAVIATVIALPYPIRFRE